MAAVVTIIGYFTSTAFQSFLLNNYAWVTGLLFVLLVIMLAICIVSVYNVRNVRKRIDGLRKFDIFTELEGKYELNYVKIIKCLENSKRSFECYALNFHKLSTQKDVIKKALERGVEIRILMFDPLFLNGPTAHAEYAHQNDSVTEPIEEVKETVRRLGELFGPMSKSAQNHLQVKMTDIQPTLRYYQSDTTQQDGEMFAFPYFTRINRLKIPFIRAKGTHDMSKMYDDYFKKIWNHHTSKEFDLNEYEAYLKKLTQKITTIKKYSDGK